MRRQLLVLTVASGLVLAALVSADGAWAAEPWWHVDTASVPSGKAGGESQVLVDISNLGDAPVRGYEQPVTVTDQLPPGLTPTTVYGEAGPGEFWSPFGKFNTEATQCMTEGQTVTCKFQGALLEYEHLMLAINVDVAQGAGEGQNEVTIAGGGAAAASAKRSLALGGGPGGYGIESYELTAEEEGGMPDTHAGSHPFQLTTTVMLNTKAEKVTKNSLNGPEAVVEAQPIGVTKDLRFNLPPGLIGNPTPLPRCSMAVFLLQATRTYGVECPYNTMVGVASPIATRLELGAHTPWVFSEPLYNLEPGVGEPARFGFSIPGGGTVILDTSVRTGGDYGVVVTVADVPETVSFIGNQVTFWGAPADSRHNTARQPCLVSFGQIFGQECGVAESAKPFLIMPTSCAGELRTTMETDAWTNIGQYVAKGYTFANAAGEPYSLEGCNQLNFHPSISLTPDGQQAATPTGLTVGVHVPQDANLNPIGLSEAAVKDTTVTLPAGVDLNPAGADGLLACGLGEIGLQSPDAPGCPEASKVGSVEISTPLLPHPLVGAAYLAQQNANPFGSLIALYLVAYDPVSGVRVKLAGQVTPDPVTGQLTSTFRETPELPFEDLRIHFFGGSRAPLGTPASCGAYTTTASITPWSDNPAVDSSSTFQITSGPHGSPCASPLPFAPQFTAGATNIQAGAFTPFTMTMSREDGNQNLDAITLHMPPGLSGTLAGVELCSEAQANAGLCGPNSQIGETTISVGLGGNPYTVSGGKVYITGPYKGAPYGLSIVNPANAGPFDVGQGACDCVVVRAKIEVDPTTAALTITSDTTGPYRIPTILDGIPLEIKHVNVTINRADFTFNPTNCEKMAITGDLTSSQGAAESLSAPFQVTNCAALGFEPNFSVSTSAHASRTNGTSLHVKLTYPNVPAGKRANVAKVRVELPKQLPSRLTTLQKACTDTVFNANPDNCPAASKVGEAVATTPIIPEDFRGPAYFVSHGGSRFPELIIVLHGYALTVELHGETFISKQGVTSTTFNTVPDVPIGSFELNLPAGPDSALAANGDLCAQKLAMPTTFTAQNGVVIEQETPIHVEGCTPEIRVLRHRVEGKWATVVVSVPSAGRLVAGGGGVIPSTKHVGKAGAITLKLRLSKREQRFVAHRQGRRLRVPIKLSFKPASGENLKATVAVLMR